MPECSRPSKDIPWCCGAGGREVLWRGRAGGAVEPGGREEGSVLRENNHAACALFHTCSMRWILHGRTA